MYTHKMLRHAIALFATVIAGFSATAQTPRSKVALTGARVLTMGEQGTIEDATVLISNGKIKQVGRSEDIKVPVGYRKVDMTGKTLMPGLVHAWSQAGFGNPRARRAPSNFRIRRRSSRNSGGRGGGGNRAATTLADKIYARQDIFADLLEVGVTTLAIRPAGSGFPGQATRLDPGAPEAPLDDASYIVINPTVGSSSKKLLKDTFAKAVARIEERKKEAAAAAEAKKKAAEEAKKKAAAEAKKKAAAKKEQAKGERKPSQTGGKPEKGGTPKPAPSPKPQPKPKPKPDGGDKPEAGGGRKPANGKTPAAAKKAKKKKVDPNLEVLADLFEGKTRAFVAASSARDILHYQPTLPADRSFTNVLVVERFNAGNGLITDVLERVEALSPYAVLMRPELSSPAYDIALINPAAICAEAGFRVGFLLDDNPDAVRGLWFALMQLVRAGLPANTALEAVTAVPAAALGLDDEVGSIAPGRRADLLVFSGDPLDPRSKLEDVYRAGRATQTEEANR